MMTQTSTTSSMWPDDILNPMSKKFKDTTKEIRRIENILYKNDKRVARYTLATDRTKNSKEEEAVSQKLR